ncbi:hypothetical protein [Arthrobacter sp. fls2-241-R2A-172]|uniref:hypothetical protein n=1 Tax=Arthrobacter sp. fls2-241-R2A-172 TaxID=3040325 RepID=UPI00254D3074|nr:hypothetical protein [Arthrobacter sp. fls2-241-R2A-172]
MNSMPAPNGRSGRTKMIRGAAAAGAVLLGGLAIGTTTAAAATPSPAPTASAPATAGAQGTAPGAHKFGRALRTELRVGIKAETGFGDKAHEVAYILIHHDKAFSKLPETLQSDLKTLEAAPAAERDSDAQKIKDTALNGGYGDKVQKIAKAIQTKLTAPKS